MDVFVAILAIVSLVAATIIVNSVYKLFMKVTGADVMFFSVKTKLISIFVVFLITLGLLLRLFGIESTG